MIIPVILAGGSGTRLWPLSRELYPKQLLNLNHANTLLQNTLLRLNGKKGVEPPIIVCNEEHRFLAAEQLRTIDIDTFTIILEPARRNTAPAIAVAAHKAMKEGSDPILLVLPADHVINNLDKFHTAMDQAVQFAKAGSLITFGIIPDAPETGYGYIKKGKKNQNGLPGFKIDRFVEKPDKETAQSYVDSGDYCWNSGMFMFKASKILAEIETFASDMIKPCRKAVEKGVEDLDFFRLDPSYFENAPSDSIDYAVMEKTDKGVVIPIDAGWNDLGSWDALWQTGKKDKNNNVIIGDVLTVDVKNSYLNAEKRLIAAVGIEDHVIVETPDAVLVAPRDRVQDVKQIVKTLKSRGREEATTHQKVYRPWGAYETVDISNRFQVKRITVNPGAKLSLQKHYHRAEHWTVVSGSVIVTKNKEEILLKEDESVYIPLGTLHRMENPGKIPLELIEVQSGSYLGEDDIVRFDDIYGRKED